MAATEILATGTTSSASADVVVASGSSITVGLKGAVDNAARVVIQLKDDAGGYLEVGDLTFFRPATVIAAAGTYRFVRKAGPACGVFNA